MEDFSPHACLYVIVVNGLSFCVGQYTEMHNSTILPFGDA